MKKLLLSLLTLQFLTAASIPEQAPFRTSKVQVNTLVDKAGTGAPVFQNNAIQSDDNNYIKNYGFEFNSITNWAHYDDDTTAIPTDGVGEAGDTDLSFTRNSIGPIRTNYDFKISKAAADAQGEGVATDFTLFQGDANKRLVISLDYTTAGAYVSSDMGIYIITDIEGSPKVINPSTVNIPASIVSGAQLKIFFNAEDVGQYRLVFHTQTINASAYQVYIDNIKVKQEEVVQTVPVGDYDVSGITIDNVTEVVTKYSGQRIGNKLRVQGAFTYSARATAVFAIVLPSGLTIDYTKYIAAASAYQTIGILHSQRNSAVNMLSGVGVSNVLFIDGATTNKIFGGYTTSSYFPIKKNADDFLTEAASNAEFEFEVYIAKWAGSSVNVANSQVEYYSTAGTWDAPSSTMAYGPAGTTMGGALAADRVKTLTTLNPIQSTDRVALEIDTGTAGFVDMGNRFPAGATFGAYVEITGVNTISVTFRRYAIGTTDWVNTYKWRVVKSSNPLSIGQITTPTSQVSLNTGLAGAGNHHGSTNTKIRRFTNSIVVGSDIVYADSATLGASLTILRAGVYSMSWSDYFSSASSHGFSLNSTELTTAISGIAAANALMFTDVAGNMVTNCSVTVRLNVGDVIRPHDDGTSTTVSNANKFVITQVAI